MTLSDDEIEFAFHCSVSGYSIESMDNFIAGGAGVYVSPDIAEQLREIRHDAFCACKSKSFDLMTAHLRALHFACHFYGARPSASIGLRRSKQVSLFGKRGAKARRKYTEADFENWRRLAASPDLARHSSKRHRAQLIAKREGLPESAAEKIRKVI